jgi:16S rRNA G1207 methylase RsmC
MATVADIALWILAAALAIPLLVLTVECLAASCTRRATPAQLDPGRQHTCAVLIPAHDEEVGLSTTLADLRPQLRQGDRILVVAKDTDLKTRLLDMLDATDLKPGGGHMHSARFRFADDKRFSSEWKFMEAGQTKFTESAEYRRVR